MKEHVDLLVTLQPREGQATELHEALIQLRAASLREPGCLDYRIGQAQSPAETFYLLERWKDAQALESHEATTHYRKGVARIQACTQSVDMQKLHWWE
ncbi:antibiotic biosynthesis monooxygenase [Pectobacterium betavasculorum]|uniref:putative quinol monooxygenase n=1 Tax=Pectobacterium betavasculorum TaxID=55207 RepID=UPI00313B5B6F